MSSGDGGKCGGGSGGSSSHKRKELEPAPSSPDPMVGGQSEDYWDGFYTGWIMALQKVSRLYGHKGLTNIYPEIDPKGQRFDRPPSPPPPPSPTPAPPSAQ